MSNRAVNRLFAAVEARQANMQAIADAWDRQGALLFVAPGTPTRWRTIQVGHHDAAYTLTYWHPDGPSTDVGFSETRLTEAISYGLEGGCRLANAAERAVFEVRMAAGFKGQGA